MTSIKELKNEKIKFKCEPSKCVEITNLLGHKYREVGRYDDAILEHNEAIVLCHKIKNQSISREYEAITRRALGECYSEMGKHVEAKAEHDIYLRLVLEQNDSIEIQRARATIGRTFLLWAQDTDTGQIQRSLLSKSAASFKKALELCEKLMSSGKLKTREYADMKSRLLLNLGLVYENLNEFDKCQKLLFESIELTKSNFLYEDLFRCQISLGSIYEKIDLLDDAHRSFKEAIQTANLLKSKTKKCDALMSIGLILLKLEDIDKARYYLKKAFYTKTPVLEDKSKAERLLKIVSVIRDDLQKLARCANEDCDQIMDLCDRLGDHFVEVKCYSLAIKYYKQELNEAKQANKPNSLLAKIYVSIGQTYCDIGNYSEAITYFTQECNLHLANKCEQSASLLKIAELQENLYNETDELDLDEKATLKGQIIANYEKAIGLFDDCDVSSNIQHLTTNSNNRDPNLKSYIHAIKCFSRFLKAHNFNIDLQDKLEKKLLWFNNINDSDDEESENEGDDIGDHIGDLYDNYKLDLLSSDSDNSAESDEEIPANIHAGRNKRNPNAAKVNRLNQFGETPLHTACIAGNILQVERLIEQKASISARDFCGWTPLHEACNHGHVEIVECLLKNGANVEACDERSELLTPLHDACNCGHFDIIKLLLKYGSNVLAVNAKNETPLECLMSWRMRTENELVNHDIEKCIALEQEMLDIMKSKGHDCTHLYDKIKMKNKSSNLNIPTVNRHQSDVRVTLKARNLVGDDIYLERNDEQEQFEQRPDRPNYDEPRTARNEYQNTMKQLRRNHLDSRFSSKLDSRDRTGRTALLSENELVPRNDWLVVDTPNDGPKKSKRRTKESCLEPDRKKMKLQQTVSSNRSIGTLIELSNSSDCETDHNIDQSMYEETESSLEKIPTKAISDWSSRGTNRIVENVECSDRMREPQIVANKPTSNQDSVCKMAIVQFNDQQKSSFAVAINRKGLTFKWLSDELSKRYFRKYAVKPVISLFTAEGAILSDEDEVSDFISVKETFQAHIESLTTDPPQKRYVELCRDNRIKPNQRLIEILRSVRLSGSFNVNNVYISSTKQVMVMFQSLFRQEVKEINLSNTNILCEKANIRCFFNLVNALPTLQVLNLSGAAFPPNYLMQLLKLSPNLCHLDLSFNSIGDDNAFILSQIIIIYDKLRNFNLSACDLSQDLFKNKNFISSIRGSNLVAIDFDYNSITPDLVNKFKSLGTDNSFLKCL